MKQLFFVFIFCVFGSVLYAQTAYKSNEIVVKFERSFVERELRSAFSDVQVRRAMPNFETQPLHAVNQRHSVVSFRPMFRTDPRHAERHRAFDLDLFFRVEFTSDDTPQDVIHSFLMEDVILSADLSIKYEIYREPNDTRFAQQWGLNNTRFPGRRWDVNVLPAWEITTGDPRVVVAIIDNVVDDLHEDLLPNMWFNQGEIPGNGIDDDGNGFIDDFRGWNFRDDNDFVRPDNVAEDHGTHVAGIVAARTNNDIGMAGVAGGWGDEPGTSMMMFRAGEGRFVNWGYEAMVYAADNGAAIAQCSWGGSIGPVITPAGAAAIAYFMAHGGGEVMNGGLVIAAAGNSNVSTPAFPGAQPGVLAVGSLDENGQRSAFSNFGVWVEICAPGAGILSTLPFNNRYGSLSGTSMAAPMVSGVAALVLAATIDFPREFKTPEWLTNVLIESGTMWHPTSPIGPIANAHAAILLAVRQLEAMVASVQPKSAHDVFILYPNPTTDLVTIVAQSDVRINSYRIITLGGATMFERQNPSREETIDMTSFPTGTYILLVESDLGFFTERIIKL